MMKFANVVMAALVIGFCSINGFAEVDVSKVATSGKAEKTVKADTALIILYISADGILMADAEKAYQEKFSKLEGILKAQFKDIQSIEQKTLAIGQKRVSYNPDQNKQPQPEIRKQLSIVIPPDSKLAFEIIDTAIRNGAALTTDPNNYYSTGQLNSTVIYGLKDCVEIEKELLKMALDDCKKNAGAISQQIPGSSLGNIANISVGGAFGAMPQNIIAGSGATPPFKYYSIEPDKIKITVTVNGSYLLHL
jgi:uncharacterized protein YggE